MYIVMRTTGDSISVNDVKKMLCKTLLLFLVWAALPVAGARAAEDDVVLQALIDAALAENPALMAARQQQAGAMHRIGPAGALADPTLSFAFSNYPVDSFESDVTPMTGNELQLAQRLPFPGKLGAKKEMAAQEALWYEGVYGEARIELIRQVRESYYRLYVVDRSIETAKMNLDLLGDLSKLAETRYRVGQGKQADVLKVQLERSRLRDRLIQLEQSRTTLQGNLNRLASRPVDGPIEIPAILPAAPAPTRELDELQALAEEQRPLFAGWKARIEKVRQQKELARLEYRPDVTLWAGYRFRDDNLPDQGTDFASAGISLNLPLNRSRRAAEVAAGESALNQAYNQFADVRNQVRYAVDESYHDARRSYQLVELYRTGILPQARQVYAALLSAYQVGNVDFQELLTALLTLNQYETELHRATGDGLRATARLAAAVGEPRAVEPVARNTEK